MALTEDTDITLALTALGYECLSPDECRVFTDVMTSCRDLWKQRICWQRGALENLRNYGMTRATVRYFVQQTTVGS